MAATLNLVFLGSPLSGVLLIFTGILHRPRAAASESFPRSFRSLSSHGLSPFEGIVQRARLRLLTSVVVPE